MRRIIVTGALVAAVAAVLALLVLRALGGDGLLARLDLLALDAGLALRSPALDTALTAVTDLASAAWLTPITLAVVVLLVARRRSWTPLVLMVAAVAGSLAITTLGKPLVGRDRPDTAFAVPPFETSLAFPSGHTLNALVVAGVLAVLLLERRRTTSGRMLVVAPLILFVVAIGVTRVVLGHHWLTDVLGGAAIGVAWLAVVVTVYALVRRRRAGVVPGVPIHVGGPDRSAAAGITAARVEGGRPGADGSPGREAGQS